MPELSPKTTAAIIAVVVLLIGAVGYSFLKGSDATPSGSDSTSRMKQDDDAKQKMMNDPKMREEYMATHKSSK